MIMIAHCIESTNVSLEELVQRAVKDHSALKRCQAHELEKGKNQYFTAYFNRSIYKF
jgi:hypothetical protein